MDGTRNTGMGHDAFQRRPTFITALPDALTSIHRYALRFTAESAHKKKQKKNVFFFPPFFLFYPSSTGVSLTENKNQAPFGIVAVL